MKNVIFSQKIKLCSTPLLIGIETVPPNGQNSWSSFQVTGCTNDEVQKILGSTHEKIHIF